MDIVHGGQKLELAQKIMQVEVDDVFMCIKFNFSLWKQHWTNMTHLVTMSLPAKNIKKEVQHCSVGLTTPLPLIGEVHYCNWLMV